jgi:hypothetical protein
MSKRVCHKGSTHKPRLSDLKDANDDMEGIDVEMLRKQVDNLQQKNNIVKFKKTKEQLAKEKFYKWVKFGVVLWAIRALTLAIGVSIGGIGILFSKIFSWLGVSNANSVPMWTYEESLNVLTAYKILQRGLPFAISDMPLNDPKNIKIFFKNFKFNKLKYNNKSSPVFSYINNKRSWKSECLTLTPIPSTFNVKNSMMDYESLMTSEIKSFPFNTNTNTDKDRDDGYWYLSQQISTSSDSSNRPAVQVRNIASSFFDFLSKISSTDTNTNINTNTNTNNKKHIPNINQAVVNLWIGNNGSRVANHYDTDDNFFYQIRGQKKFFITEPLGHDLYAPHSYLHPQWRQAQAEAPAPALDQLLTETDTAEMLSFDSLNKKFDDLMKMKRAYVAEELSKKKSKWKIKVKVDGKCEDKGKVENSKECLNENENDNEIEMFDMAGSTLDTLPRSWEITLKPGDMLFLPAYYYHTVQTVIPTLGSSDDSTSSSKIYSDVPDASVSLNVWFPSAALEATAPLSKVPLPFIENNNNNFRLQLNCLSQIAKLVYSAVTVTTDGTYTVTDTDTDGSATTPKQTQSFKQKYKKTLIKNNELRTLLNLRHIKYAKAKAKANDSSIKGIRDGGESMKYPSYCQNDIDLKLGALCPLSKNSFSAADEDKEETIDIDIDVDVDADVDADADADADGDATNLSEKKLNKIFITSNNIIKILNKIDNISIRVVVFLDYIDEIFSIIANKSNINTKQSMITFVQECF